MWVIILKYGSNRFGLFLSLYYIIFNIFKYLGLSQLGPSQQITLKNQILELKLPSKVKPERQSLIIKNKE